MVALSLNRVVGIGVPMKNDNFGILRDGWSFPETFQSLGHTMTFKAPTPSSGPIGNWSCFHDFGCEVSISRGNVTFSSTVRVGRICFPWGTNLIPS